MASGTELRSVPKEVSKLFGNEDFRVFYFNGHLQPELCVLNQREGLDVSTEGGLTLQLGQEKSIRGKLIYLYGKDAKNPDRASEVNHQVHINIKPGAKLSLLEAHVSKNEMDFSSTIKTEVHVNESASLNYAKVFWLGEEARIESDTNTKVDANGSAHFVNINFGGKKVNNNFIMSLLGQSAHGQALALTLARGKEIIENKTTIAHLFSETTSEQLYKGVYTDSSRGLFDGRIQIIKEAQKSKASQLSKSIIIGELAQVDVKPQLEVYADDVKANHGATIAKLNADELFYLQSRAIGEVEAQKLLAHGFCSDVIERMNDDFLREHLRPIVKAAMPLISPTGDIQ